MNEYTHGGRGLIAGIASLMLLACPAAAQQWSGLGTNDNWSTGANWVGGVAPASSPTTAVSFIAPAPRLTPVVWTINRIDFIGNYNIGGQPLTFAGFHRGGGRRDTDPVRVGNAAAGRDRCGKRHAPEAP